MSTLTVVTTKADSYALPHVDLEQARRLVDMFSRGTGLQLAFTNKEQAILIVPIQQVAYVKVDDEIIYERAVVVQP